MFDPSGKMSLNEAMITTAIIGNLSAIAVGTCSEAGQQAYADFGEYIFPDAFVLGVNGYMSIPLIYMLQSALGFPHTPTQANYIRAYGREILFSVTSGQIGYFKTKTHGTEIGANLPIGEIGVEVYRGMVWNLWNADNYEGPFHSWSLNLPHVDRAPALRGSLFFDAVNAFKGSWGVGRSIWSSSNYQQKIHIGYGYIDYRFNATTINYRTEAEIIASILTSIYITNIFVNSQSLEMPANMLELALHTTLWVQTGMAKYFWNNSSTGYSLETRQNHPRKDYPNFQSGPGLFFAGQYLVE